ncbi:MAG: VWA domain-containing protein [Bryobacterales bacterium]|nr:VWA domain-containing protein [Bryobacterales bacterium]
MLLALLFPLIPVLSAQPAPFATQSRLVLVPVTVADTKGRSIDGLEADAFTLYDNGQRRDVTVDTIGTGVAPLALVVAVQAAGISQPVLDKVGKIGAMIQPLLSGERGCAALLAFAEDLRWLSECTRDANQITRAFQNIAPGAPKTARLLDAVSAAADRLRSLPNRRRVLLLISESRDRGSESELQPVIQDLLAEGISVYAANYSAFKTAFTTRTPKEQKPVPPDPRRPPPGNDLESRNGAPPGMGAPVDILGGFGELFRLGSVNTTEALTKATGGAVYSFARLKGLEEAIQKLAAEVHSQYLLSFAPPSDPQPGFHSLRVDVKAAAAIVRARPGYWVR